VLHCILTDQLYAGVAFSAAALADKVGFLRRRGLQKNLFVCTEYRKIMAFSIGNTSKEIKLTTAQLNELAS